MDRKYNKLLVFIIIIGFLAALPLLWQRYQLEENSRSVEMVMDYDDIQTLARREGQPVNEVFAAFKQAGITTLAVYDATLKKLHDNGEVTVLTGADVFRAGLYSTPQKQTNDGNLDREALRRLIDVNSEVSWLKPAVVNGEIAANDVVIVGHDNYFPTIVEDLQLRLGDDRVKTIDGGNLPAVAVKADLTELLKMNLGLSLHEIDEVNRYGLAVLPRPTNYNQITKDKIDSVFRRIDRADNLSGLMFTGTEVLGFPNLINYTAEKMNDRDMTLGLIEHPVQYQFVRQDGLFDLVALVGYRAARAYAIPKDEQPKMELKPAVHRWALSDQERDIRINLLRTFEKPFVNQTLLATNLTYVQQVSERLRGYDFAIGKAGLFSNWHEQSFYSSQAANTKGFPRYLTLLCIFAVVAATVLLITQLITIPVRWQYIIFAVLAIIAAITLRSSSMWLLSRQMAALAAAIVFPVLAMTIALDKWSIREKISGGLGKTFAKASGYLFLTSVVSLAGAFLLAATLTDVRFLLEIDTYRGVKLTFSLPILLMILVYLSRYDLVDGRAVSGLQGLGERIMKIIRMPVTIGVLSVLAVAGLAMLFMVLRSGHTEGAPVPMLEIKMRTALEYLTYARPREKEFLIGHPAFILSFVFLYFNWPRWLHFVAIVGGVIGQGSMIETFAHMRTPFLMSLVRGLDGIVGGVIVGFIATLIIYILYRLFRVYYVRQSERVG